MKVKWKNKVEKEDCEAAAKYLSLLFAKRIAKTLAVRLRSARIEYFDAKDILRASQTHLLNQQSAKVKKDLKKIKDGEALSPVLLVRGNGQIGVTLTIADGYHRFWLNFRSWLKRRPPRRDFLSGDPDP